MREASLSSRDWRSCSAASLSCSRHVPRRAKSAIAREGAGDGTGLRLDILDLLSSPNGGATHLPRLPPRSTEPAICRCRTSPLTPDSISLASRVICQTDDFSGFDGERVNSEGFRGFKSPPLLRVTDVQPRQPFLNEVLLFRLKPCGLIECSDMEMR